MLDRQYGNRVMTITRTITQLMALKILKGPRYKKVKVLLLSMQILRARLKAVSAESPMLNGEGAGAAGTSPLHHSTPSLEVKLRAYKGKDCQ